MPTHGAWYTANVWGNFFVVPILVAGGFLWSKTRFWPLRPIKHAIQDAHRKLDESLAHHHHNQLMIEELHHKLHTGEDHPRVKARKEAGLHPTPVKPDSKT